MELSAGVDQAYKLALEQAVYACLAAARLPCSKLIQRKLDAEGGGAGGGGGGGEESPKLRLPN